MKKIVFNLCILSAIFTLTACSLRQDSPSADTEEEITTANSEKEIENMTASPTDQKITITENQEEPEPDEAVSRTINLWGLTAFFADSDEEPVPFNLTLVSEKENGISDAEDWLEENNLYLPMANGHLYEIASKIQKDAAIDYERWQPVNATVFFDDNYIYEWRPENVIIYDKASCHKKYVIQVSSTLLSPLGNCAALDNGILYVGSIHNGYAMENSCYLMAYDIENDKVLWRSEDQTYNSRNFIVKDDIIICSYGFTAEADYIYQISKVTGKVLSKTPVAKMPYFLVEKDGQLYVHTYSYDYIFNIE